jgi:hypothetical protein
MKFKFLSIIMAVAVALAFTSCDTKKASASDKSESASEQVEESAEEKVEEPKAPTGDAAADAKQCVEEAIALMKTDLKSIADADKMEKDIDALQKKYEDFYKAKGEAELKKFNDECDKLQNDPEIVKKLDEAQKVMMENAQKLLGETGK